ncbi:MAG: acetolactate synthase large subunit [Caulobacteraceae bacterium]|nr:acetolactate synthase large subunit [Caulobacteraceae bacterium]
MNGADTLIETLIENDVTACFANPGTSEMQFVSALDRQPAMRPVLCLFEGVATGAADGYGRIAGKPACTLLHLGPGYGNGLANLHNARRAFTPIVNVIGDHATYHRRYDAPLASDIAAIAGANSVWVKSAEGPDQVADLAAEAVGASYGPPGGSASLILPADCAWSPAVLAARPKAIRRGKSHPDGTAVEAVARRMKAAKKPVLVLGQGACGEAALAAAARLATLGVRILTDTFIGRQPRGAGRFLPDRMMYFGEQALEDLAGVDLMALVETDPPAAFFAYPGRPSLLVPEGCETTVLASREQDGAAAISMLAEALGAPASGPVQPLERPAPRPGVLTPSTVGAAVGRHLPEGAIVCDDGVTASQPILNATRSAPPHDWMALTGGAIGLGIPMSIGAAVAAPGRKVISLNGDGAAMYTPQGLWTLAREGLDVTVIIFANRNYRVLNIELGRTGAGNPGPAAAKLLSLDDPRIDWLSLAKGLGVPATRCDDADAFETAFARAMAEPGPRLIEAALP